MTATRDCVVVRLQLERGDRRGLQPLQRVGARSLRHLLRRRHRGARRHSPDRGESPRSKVFVMLRPCP